MPQPAEQMVTVSSQPGTVTNLILPDGSRVWLNTGSTISYPNEFSGSTRDISLTGEAYFEVVKDKQIPMVVEAGNARIKVYGTIFNVNAFSSEPFLKVTLVEGSVSLSSPSGKLNGKEEFFIKPGQTAIFNEQSKQVLVQNEDGITPLKRGVGETLHCYHIYIFKYDEAKFNYLPKVEFVKMLEAEGVPCFMGYPEPLYKQPLFQQMNFMCYAIPRRSIILKFVVLKPKRHVTRRLFGSFRIPCLEQRRIWPNLLKQLLKFRDRYYKKLQ